MDSQPRSPLFYPMLILTGLASFCALLFIIAAAVGKFSWIFALVWCALLAAHVLNFRRAMRVSRDQARRGV